MAEDARPADGEGGGSEGGVHLDGPLRPGEGEVPLGPPGEGRRHQLVLGARLERVGGPGVWRSADTEGERRGGGGLHQRRPGPSADNRAGVQRGEHAAVGAASGGDADGIPEPFEGR